MWAVAVVVQDMVVVSRSAAIMDLVTECVKKHATDDDDKARECQGASIVWNSQILKFLQDNRALNYGRGGRQGDSTPRKRALHACMHTY